jgi:hypothetical protein
VAEPVIHRRARHRRPARAPWTIRPQDAALLFDVFLFGMMRHDIGHLLDTDAPPRDCPIAVE